MKSRSLSALAGWLPIYLPVLLLAGALKWHYRQADAEQLRWILAPTAGLVNLISGSGYRFLEGVGWCEPSGEFIIAPACAGVNFLILLLLLGVGLHLHQLPRAAWRYVWVLLAPAVAWGCTLLVNSVRILVSVQLYQADIYGGWLTPERVHRLAGILLYLSALWMLLSLLQKIAARIAARRDPLNLSRRWLVLGLYAVMTILIPLLNGAYCRFGQQFTEHALTVAFIGLLMAVATPSRSNGSLSPPGRGPG